METLEKNKNKVFVNKDGYMEVHYIGEQTEGTIFSTHFAHKKLSIKKHLDKKPIKYIVDLTKLTKNDSSSRKAVLTVLNDLNVEKLAVYGGGIFLKTLTNFIFTVAGKRSNMKYFNSRKSAEEWLK